MKTRAILFDKDGTLLDFDTFWVPISRRAIEYMLRKVNRTDISVNTVLEAFGIKDNTTVIDGVLCCGTYAKMGEVFYKLIENPECKFSMKDIVSLVVQSYHDMIDEGRVEPVCENLRETLLLLKEKNIKLIVVTTDDQSITQRCLEKLRIADVIDEIYTDDGLFPAKPDSYCIEEICKKYGYSKSELIMVGDTLTDALFAKNGGIRFIGVAKCEENRSILAEKTDVVIREVSQILSVIG